MRPATVPGRLAIAGFAHDALETDVEVVGERAFANHHAQGAVDQLLALLLAH